jgi:hypothetical protein
MHVVIRIDQHGDPNGLGHQLVQKCQALRHPAQNKLDPTRDRRIALSAIGQCLKDQYDALATPTPPHLAALVKQLETR